MLKDLINEFKEGLIELLKNHSEEDRLTLLQWVADEYRNFMLISREQYSDTLRVIINGDYENKDLFIYILENIERYGATKCFYVASSELIIQSRNRT